ncbi:MAG: DoxX family membrane protein [Desulfobacterales bacterium]|nr:DoxX family membrane protein [Desulfobacterales bacterium]
MFKLSINIAKYNGALRIKTKRGFLSTKSIFIWLYHVARVSLSVIFLWSGISKLFDPVSFAIIIDAYGLIPEMLSLPAAILLSCAEFIAGLGLLFDIRGSLSSISLMLVFFMAILLYGMWLGLDIDCGCFSLSTPESKTFHDLSTAFFRDSTMLSGILYLYAYRYVQSLTPMRLMDVFNKINKGDNSNEENY